MALRVVYAGQDVSLLVKESSITIDDQLGQGAGVASGSSGRATTCSFLISKLGPASSAVGAGSTIPAFYSNIYSANQSDIETDTSGFASFVGASGSLSRDTSTAWQGTASLKVITDGSATFQYVNAQIQASQYTVGNTYTASFYVKGAVAGGTLRYFVDSNSGAVSSVNTLTLTTGWQRLSVTFTAASGKTWMGLRLDTGGTAQSLTFWWDGLMIEQSSTADAWIRGGTTSTGKLVRYGDVTIYDSTNTAIFGGKATILEDQTVKLTNYVKVSCVDYWQFLETITVNEVYSAQTDIFIIGDLLTKYAPWVDRSLLPTTPSLTFTVENFTHFTLRKALQRITDKTGYIIWVDPTKHIRYINPTKTTSAPFSLSDEPNFSTSFQCGITDYVIDDTATVNRVYFYGGKSLSNDLTQDLTNQADGTNDLFVLAYYPHKSSDGSFHLKVNGTDVALGFDGSTGASNTLISDGGTAVALINIDSHTIKWSAGSIPTGAVPVTFIYRREIPLLVVLTDNASHNFYGQYFDGVISDSSVFDQETAIRRCKTLLYEQAYGLETLTIKCWRAGLASGQILRVDHAARNIHKSFIIQSVNVTPKGGGGFFEYTITCGAWNLNLVDIVMELARQATPEDESSTEQETTIAITQVNEAVGIHETWTTATRTMGMYYPRATPVGDGHDAYPGLFSI